METPLAQLHLDCSIGDPSIGELAEHVAIDFSLMEVKQSVSPMNVKQQFIGVDFTIQWPQTLGGGYRVCFPFWVRMKDMRRFSAQLRETLDKGEGSARLSNGDNFFFCATASYQSREVIVGGSLDLRDTFAEAKCEDKVLQTSSHQGVPLCGSGMIGIYDGLVALADQIRGWI